MTARLTTEAVRKLFGGYPSAEEIRERNRQKAQAAIENYNEMLEKVKHAVADLDTAHETLMTNIYDNNVDINNSDTMRTSLENAKEWIERAQGLARMEVFKEEEKARE